MSPFLTSTLSHLTPLLHSLIPGRFKSAFTLIRLYFNPTGNRDPTRAAPPPPNRAFFLQIPLVPSRHTVISSSSIVSRTKTVLSLRFFAQVLKGAESTWNLVVFFPFPFSAFTCRVRIAMLVSLPGLHFLSVPPFPLQIRAVRPQPFPPFILNSFSLSGSFFDVF